MPEPAPFTEADLERLRLTESWTVHVPGGEIGARPGVTWVRYENEGLPLGFVIRDDVVLGPMQHALPTSLRRDFPHGWAAVPAATFQRLVPESDVRREVAKYVGDQALADAVTVVWDDTAPAPATPALGSPVEGEVRPPTRPVTVAIHAPEDDDMGWHVGSEDLVRLWGLEHGPAADDVVLGLLAERAPHLLEAVELDSYEEIFSAYADTAEAADDLARLLQGEA